MTNIKISIHNRNIQKRIDSIKDWEISQEDKKDILKFLEDLELGKVNRGKKVGESRRLKYLDILKIPLTFWNKPTSKITLKDMEDFVKFNAVYNSYFAESLPARETVEVGRLPKDARVEISAICAADN